MNINRAVIFDMDGVLVDTYHAHFQSWLMIAKQAGFSFTEAEFGPTFGRTSREIIAHFWSNRQLNNADIDALAAEKEEAFRKIISRHFPVMSGIHSLLVDLYVAGWKLAVGSSGPPENVEFVLDRLQKRDLFSALVTGMDVTRGKPDPQVFLLAAKRLNMPASKCVVIEDAQPGIEAAHAAGIAAVGLVSTGRTREELAAADLVVDSLSELSPRLLEEIIDQCGGK